MIRRGNRAGRAPSQLGGATVQRRYRHFLWLHERLCDRYPFVLMPPMPDKQVQGRFEVEFIEHRRRQLERFLNRIVRHPNLRASPLLMQFLKSATLPVPHPHPGGAVSPARSLTVRVCRSHARLTPCVRSSSP